MEPHTALYQPLGRDKDEIRLLRFLPPDDNSMDIHGIFEIFPMERAPKYIALSYEWGTAKIPENPLVKWSLDQVKMHVVEEV
jgi:hypothetical protein